MLFVVTVSEITIKLGFIKHFVVFSRSLPKTFGYWENAFYMQLPKGKSSWRKQNWALAWLMVCTKTVCAISCCKG